MLHCDCDSAKLVLSRRILHLPPHVFLPFAHSTAACVNLGQNEHVTSHNQIYTYPLRAHAATALCCTPRSELLHRRNPSLFQLFRSRPRPKTHAQKSSSAYQTTYADSRPQKWIEMGLSHKAIHTSHSWWFLSGSPVQLCTHIYVMLRC